MKPQGDNTNADREGKRGSVKKEENEAVCEMQTAASLDLRDKVPNNLNF